MKKRIGALALFVLVAQSVYGYTFRICYIGSDDAEVVAPDSITVDSTIHGGSACWTSPFAVTINKGESRDVVVEPMQRTNPDWNCHLVPGSVNGETVRPTQGFWPLMYLQGPGAAEGETWTIKIVKPIIETSPLMPDEGQQVTYTIQWFAEVQDGLQACAAAQ